MLKMIALAALMLPMGLVAQPNLVPFHGGVLNVRADGVVAYIDGAQFSLATSSALPFGDPVQGPIVGADQPYVITRWRSKDGSEHEVKTPIVSVTPAGISKAKATHKLLVDEFQALWPPAP